MPDTMPMTAPSQGDRAPALNPIAAKRASYPPKVSKDSSAPPAMISAALSQSAKLSSRWGLSEAFLKMTNAMPRIQAKTPMAANAIGKYSRE